MSFEEFLKVAWPWIWPSLALGAWLSVTFVGLRVTRRWIRQRLSPTDLFGVEDKVLDRVAAALFIGFVLFGLFAWVLLVPFDAEVGEYARTEISPWVMATLLMIAFIAAGVYVLRRALIVFTRRALQTETRWDDAIALALNRPMIVTILLLGINLWAELVPLPDAVASYIATGSETGIVLLIVLFADGLVQGWMIAHSKTSKVLQTSGVVLRAAVRIALYTVGGLMALSALGIDVTPILASLGVSSIAIGLALQSTLEDFIAGLLLAADKPISVGDFVELEGGLNGVVLSIGWRTARVLTREDMHVIVPNSKLAKSTLVNRSRPREACKFTAPCGVHYDSDLDRVAGVVVDVAGQVQKGDPRGVSDFQPRCVFTGFADSSVNFSVWLCAKSWEQHFGLKDNFIRSLHRRFRQEGIVIPYPIRTLDLGGHPSFPVSHLTLAEPPADGER